MAAQLILSQPQLFELEYDRTELEALGRHSVADIYVKQILTKPTGSLKMFDYTLNPYIGCGFACTYCYAAFFQADEERKEKWGTWVEVKRNAAEVLRRKRDLLGKRLFMGSATDPYQPLEGKVRLTRELVEILSEPGRQPRLHVQTRGPLVTRDLDLFKRFKEVKVNMSITTDDDEIRKRFEPSCASIERRLEAITEVARSGVSAGIMIKPMLPLHDPESFAQKLKATGVHRVYASGFDVSDRPFAASTREPALKIAAEMGWDKKALERALWELKKAFPMLNERSVRNS